jgi:hypothetical protein
MGLSFSALEIKSAHHIARFIKTVHVKIEQANPKRIDDRHLPRL